VPMYNPAGTDIIGARERVDWLWRAGRPVAGGGRPYKN